MCEQKKKILMPIIQGFGKNVQKIKAIEELSELQKELCKSLIDMEKYDIDKITEEMADVSIMLDQLLIIFGNEKKMQEIVAYKIERTYSKLGIKEER